MSRSEVLWWQLSHASEKETQSTFILKNMQTCLWAIVLISLWVDDSYFVISLSTLVHALELEGRRGKILLPGFTAPAVVGCDWAHKTVLHDLLRNLRDRLLQSCSCWFCVLSIGNLFTKEISRASCQYGIGKDLGGHSRLAAHLTTSSMLSIRDPPVRPRDNCIKSPSSHPHHSLEAPGQLQTPRCVAQLLWG